MADFRISDLTTASVLNDSDLLEISQVDQNSASGYASAKTTLVAIATKLAKATNFSDLTTTSKNLVGSINEVKHIAELIPTFAIEVVQALPTQDISDTTIYLLPAEDPEVGNYYEEYIYVNNSWELVGTTAVDLSDYYTKSKVDTALAGKVDKVTGKGLSTNDFVSTGTYPSLVVGESATLTMRKYIQTGADNSAFVFRQFPAAASGATQSMNKLIGGSVVWNQLVDTDTESVTIPSGHKYILWNGSALSLATSDGTAVSVTGGTDKFYDITQMFPSAVANAMTTAKFAQLYPNYANYSYSAPTIQSTKVSGKKVVGKNLFDKTNINQQNSYLLSTGSITTPGGLVEWRISKQITIIGGQKYTLSGMNESAQNPSICWYSSTDGYISGVPYSGNTNITVTAPTNAKYARISISLSKLDTAQLEFGEVSTAYEPYTTTTYDLSGSHLVKRNYEYRAYASGDESLPDTITDGTNTVTKRTTPITETVTNPTLYGIWKLDANNNLYFDGDSVEDIPNPQVVEAGGTEQFTDAEVSANNRDVSIPAGQDATYYAVTQTSQMSLPEIPLNDGDYTLGLNVNSGVLTWSWESTS